MAIRNFRHRGLKLLFERAEAKGVPAHLVNKLEDMLAAMDTARLVEDVGLFPGWRLHALKGELAGFWSLTVSGNWRLIFRFENGDAYDVDYIDYH